MVAVHISCSTAAVRATTTVALRHGAGTGMDTPVMEFFATRLGSRASDTFDLSTLTGRLDGWPGRSDKRRSGLFSQPDQLRLNASSRPSASRRS
jgi:predicted alpha/beta-hydrolase family hydrolase